MRVCECICLIVCVCVPLNSCPASIGWNAVELPPSLPNDPQAPPPPLCSDVCFSPSPCSEMLGAGRKVGAGVLCFRPCFPVLFARGGVRKEASRQEPTVWKH